MTKKDYILIAKALCDARMPCAGRWDASHIPTNRVVDDVIRLITQALAEENPRFDKQRFLDACAYMKGSS